MLHCVQIKAPYLPLRGNAGESINLDVFEEENVEELDTDCMLKTLKTSKLCQTHDQ